MTTKTSVTPFSVDIDRVLCSLNTDFNPLHKEFLLDFHVSGARDGYVFLTIALPEGMTRVFVSMLQSMAGFFRFIDIKAKSAVAERKATDLFRDPEHRAKVDALHADFQKRACDLFDGFISEGKDIKESVRLTNSALKAQKEPWATHDFVMSVLRSAGRFRKKKGVKA